MGWLSRWITAVLPSRAPALDPDAFSARVAERLEAAMPGVPVRVVTSLSLEVDREGGRQAVFLDNAYRFAAQASESDHGAVIDAFVASVVSSNESEHSGIDDVVPVLKSPGWFDELPRREDGRTPRHLTEPVNDALTIVYAVDTPHNVSYVEAEWFEQRDIGVPGLRKRAIENLRGRLPGLEVQRGAGLNLVVAGGYYEASVLLFDDFWARETPRLKGDPVIGLPARDVLLFADGADAKAVAELAQYVRDIHTEAAYALSPHAFIRDATGAIKRLDDR